MASYILRRLASVVPLLLGITFAAFALINLIPADPAEVALRVNDTVPSEEAVAELRKEMGLDEPFLVRYGTWLSRSLRGDFGYTYTNNNRTVAGEFARSLPATIELALATLLILVAVSVPLAVACAAFRDSFFDKAVRAVLFMGTAVPNYWAGLLFMWLFALKLRMLPSSGSGSLAHLVLPAMTLSLTYIPTYVRLVRNAMIETMGEDFVLYARARGLSEKRVLFGYILLNSIHSSVTALGMSIPQLIAGAVAVENIFAWPGVGRLCVSAIFNRDYPVIQAYVLIMGCLFVFFNLAVDIAQVLMDPRQRRKAR